jgi:hypothetical protein
MIAKPYLASLRPMITEPIARLIVAAVAIMMAAARIPMLGLMHRPAIVWDEMTYLNFARFLAGAGPPLDFHLDPSVEHAGYGFVIAPAFITHAPFEIAYHLALGINLILGLSLTLLTYRIGRRVAGASRSIALLCAIAITAYPAFFLLPLFIFSENVVFPLVLLAVLAFYELLKNNRRYEWHLAFAFSIISVWFAHETSVILVAIALCAIGLLAVKRRIPVPFAIADVIVILLGIVAVQSIHQHLWALSWGPKDDLTWALPAFFSAVSIKWLIDSIHALCDQQAAILLPSLGAYLLALGTLLRELFIARKATWSARALTCAFALAATLGLAIASAFFLALVPNWWLSPEAAFATRYVEEGAVAALAIGLPLFFSGQVQLRPFAYWASAAIVLMAVVASFDYSGNVYLNPGEPISELAWAAFSRLLRGGSMLALALAALVGLAIVLGTRRSRPVVSLLALIVVWLAASAAEVRGQIEPAQSQYDHLLGAYTSKLTPYVRAMPQFPDVTFAQSNLNIFTYNLLALDVPSHRFSVVAWPPGGAPQEQVAVAAESVAPRGFTKIICEEMPPIGCLYVRDSAAIAYLSALKQMDAFGPHPVLTLGDGLEIGVQNDGLVTWDGVYAIDKTPEMTAFRWTNGNARVILPATAQPVASARIEFVSPNAGHVTIEIQRPGARPVRVVDAPDVINANAYSIPIGAYVPGTAVLIRTTNVHPASTPGAKLSVEIRAFRLMP